MSKTRRRPTDPATVAAARLAAVKADQRERRHDPARWEEERLSTTRREALERHGVEVATDLRGRLKHARKADVFAIMLERNALTRDQHDAARRLQDDMIERKGYGRVAPDGVIVDRCGDAAAVTQRMVDAGVAVDLALKMVGPPSSRILIALLDPDAGVEDWRAVIDRITGETNDRGQNALIRIAAQGLVDVYPDVDKALKRRADEKGDRMAVTQSSGFGSFGAAPPANAVGWGGR